MTQPSPKGQSDRAKSGQARRDRARKLGDAARVLPFLAGVLMMIPLLWPREGPEGVATSVAGIYLFLIWGASIAAAALLARVLTGLDPAPPANREDVDGDV